MGTRDVGRSLVIGLIAAAMYPLAASAQPIATIRWQLQPFCNTLTMTVTQAGDVYTLDGVDDLCGGANKAAAAGIAFPKADGTVGIGLTIVLASGATPLHVNASIDMSTMSGGWQDSGGNTGAFIFNPAISPGSPRPAPKSVFPAGLSAGNTTIVNVGAPVNGTDATNKTYVDQKITSSSYWMNVNPDATVRSKSANLNGTTVVRAPGYPTGFYCIKLPQGLGIQTEVAVGSVQQLFGGDGDASRLTVTRTYGSGCNPTNFSVAVQTYNAAGALADRPFLLFIPQ